MEMRRNRWRTNKKRRGDGAKGGKSEMGKETKRKKRAMKRKISLLLHTSGLQGIYMMFLGARASLKNVTIK
jgi:hypothetical protein